MARAARYGVTSARAFLSFQAEFFAAICDHLGHDACAYLIVMYQGGQPVKTWDEVKRLTAAYGWSNGDGWDKSQGDYGQLTVMALRLIAAALDDKSYADRADKLVAEGAPFTDPTAWMRDLTFRMR